MSQGSYPARENHIAIAGAGIIGLSAAWRLAQSGRQVTVFDQGAVGAEASWAGAGMLSLGGEIEGASPLAALAIRSRKLYRDFVRELEQSSARRIDYQECGGLDLAYSADELSRLEERATVQARLGISSKLLTADHVSKFWPLVQSAGLLGGRFYPDDGIVNPRELVSALQTACCELGVSIVPHCAVESVEVCSSAAIVQTLGHREAYHSAVIAAGAWSSRIPVHPVPPIPPCVPVKGHLIGYQQPDQTCTTIVRRGHTYLLQRANGLLIAGSSVEHVGFDRGIQTSTVGKLAQEAGFVFPHLSETNPSEVWTGFRPGADALQIGAWHSPRLYLAYGHFRNGILMAPATAQLLAEEVNANWEMR